MLGDSRLQLTLGAQHLAPAQRHIIGGQRPFALLLLGHAQQPLASLGDTLGIGLPGAGLLFEQVGADDLDQQSTARRLLAQGRGQVVMTGRLGEVFHPAEEIQFEVRDPERGDTQVLAITLIGRRVVEMLTITLKADVQGRTTVGVADTVQRPGFEHTQARQLEITIETERQQHLSTQLPIRCQLRQQGLFIGGQGRRHHRCGGCNHAFTLLPWHRQRRSLVVGSQGTRRHRQGKQQPATALWETSDRLGQGRMGQHRIASRQ